MLNFLKPTKSSAEILKTMFEIRAGTNASSQESRESWSDEEVSFATYSRERDCLFLFVIFSAIQQCKLPAAEKDILLNLFREVLSGDVKRGKVDPQMEINLQDYCDAINAPHPEHLTPLWNIGLAFARHIGADKDIVYVQSGSMDYGESLLSAVKFLNTVGKSYRIVKS